MVSVNLAQQLSGHVFPFMLVFTRFGTALMLFPGLGESYVPPQVRLMFALLLSFLLFPVLMPQIPAEPKEIADLVLLIAEEALIGIFFGSLLRLLVGVAETAGGIISVQTGLSNAMILNPALATQSALPSAFLGTAAICVLFLTGLDQMLLRGLMETYTVFPAGAFLAPGDMAQAYTKMIAGSFAAGIEISAPFLIIGMLFFFALGFMQRLVPQVQLFLVALPVQIWGGLVLFAASMGTMLTFWLHYFDASVGALLAR